MLVLGSVKVPHRDSLSLRLVEHLGVSSQPLYCGSTVVRETYCILYYIVYIVCFGACIESAGKSRSVPNILRLIRSKI